MQEATCGNSSLTSIPLCPCFLNFHGEASRLPVAANSNLGLAIGSGLPSISVSLGFGSKVSTCETPPCMNRKITRLARGAKCGVVACASSPSKAANATPPKPQATWRKASRREIWPVISILDEQELTQRRRERREDSRDCISLRSLRLCVNSVLLNVQELVSRQQRLTKTLPRRRLCFRSGLTLQ